MPSSDNYTKQKRINKRNPRIIISRTDNIGDVVLALPMAGAIKKAIPGAYIMFLGKPYTRDIIEMSQSVDEFVDWEKIKKQTRHKQIISFKKLKADYIVHALAVRQIAVLARKAGIPKRIGSTGRMYHWRNCNKLILMTRRRSKLHEAQLNMKLLKAFGINRYFSIEDIIDNYHLIPPNILPDTYRDLIENDKFNLILHPRSKGSAREWGMQHYSELISLLPEDKFRIFISGTADDSLSIQNELLSKHPSVTDLSGKLSLVEFISFIANADGMVACSTGPLHIAAALNKFAIGIYPPIKPMHPGRWAPIGTNASYLVANKKCSKCRLSERCECIESITPEEVKKRLMEVFKPDPAFVDII
jgi:heptosyltransferase III